METTTTWVMMNKKTGKVVSEDVARISVSCPFCGEFAITLLPSWEMAKQTDDTNAVCNPAFRGCNNGFHIPVAK